MIELSTEKACRSYKHGVLLAFYVVATVQFVWCYLWLTRAYVSTALYEIGKERMPFQGRILMIFPLRWAAHSQFLQTICSPLHRSHFWFPRPVPPEVLVQAVIFVGCLLLTGWMTTQIYRASSSHRLLTPFVYPLLLVTCAATYVFHTVQNFRFIYDLPSLAFFSVAMYLMYFRKHWGWFAALFVVSTINRETTLLLLPLYLINEAAGPRGLEWRKLLRLKPLAVVMPLGLFWCAWQAGIHHYFAHNVSEFYPRINWNVKSLLAPLAWPQLLSAGGYLLLFAVTMRRRIADLRLRSWLLLVPVWLVFMFVYGILVETRVFGELIPLIVCCTALICEQLLLARVRRMERRRAPLVLVETRIEVHEPEAA